MPANAIPQQRTLEEIRMAQNLTQAQVAESVNVTPPYISMLETGKKTNPSSEVARRHARVLGITMDEYYEALGRDLP